MDTVLSQITYAKARFGVMTLERDGVEFLCSGIMLDGPMPTVLGQAKPQPDPVESFKSFEMCRPAWDATAAPCVIPPDRRCSYAIKSCLVGEEGQSLCLMFSLNWLVN